MLCVCVFFWLLFCFVCCLPLVGAVGVRCCVCVPCVLCWCLLVLYFGVCFVIGLSFLCFEFVCLFALLCLLLLIFGLSCGGCSFIFVAVLLFVAVLSLGV